jgi:type IV secretion system protein VirD4
MTRRGWLLAGALLAYAGAVIAGAEIAASYSFAWGTRLLGRLDRPSTAWIDYLNYAGPNPRLVKLWLLGGALVGALVLLIELLPAIAVWQRRRRLSTPWFSARRDLIRGVSDNHGHAEWMTMAALGRLFTGPHSSYGGVVVGEAYRVDRDRSAVGRFDPRVSETWGRGGSAPLLIDPCTDGPTHSLVIAGAGGFKTSCAIATLLHWTGSAVVLDPSCEIGPMLTRARSSMGHTVVTLDPRCPQDGAFNVLDWIDISDPLAETNVHAVIGWIYGDDRATATSEEAKFFRQRAKELTACLLTDMLWDTKLPPERRNLRTLRAGIVTPEKRMRVLLRAIYNKSNSRMARELAGSLMEIVDDTFSGIYANANESTSWLSVPAYADLVSGPGFSSADLATGKLTVFIQIPLKALEVTPALARVIVGALLNAVYESDGAVKGRVLFLLDEARRLGPMAILKTARDAGRKYGITLQLLYQSVGQIIDQWGIHEKRSWYDGVSWRAYAAVQDPETAKEFIAYSGSYGVIAYSEGENSGRQARIGLGSRSWGTNESRHEISRLLIRPEELMQDARVDEQFIIARGAPPIRCGRAIWFRRDEMTSLVIESRFNRSVA